VSVGKVNESANEPTIGGRFFIIKRSGSRCRRCSGVNHRRDGKRAIEHSCLMK